MSLLSRDSCAECGGTEFYHAGKMAHNKVLGRTHWRYGFWKCIECGSEMKPGTEHSKRRIDDNRPLLRKGCLLAGYGEQL